MFEALALAALDYSTTLKSTLAVIGVAGFVVAVLVGSIAWYASKKPAGWENAKAPGWLPKVGPQESESSDSES
jgi:hypothetical protein